jgi:hypothetical protein
MRFDSFYSERLGLTLGVAVKLASRRRRRLMGLSTILLVLITRPSSYEGLARDLRRHDPPPCEAHGNSPQEKLRWRNFGRLTRLGK